tara:strand:- start:1960 stop:3132 length:1173 start_codon:yes stop_codon:yes gene_type:complete
MEESQNETINISDTVAEITSVISKHLIKVIEQVSSKNNDASQNMEILNQLPIVKNLKSENEKLKQELQTLQEKYKSTLEELVQLKSNDKITMEITELGTTTNNTVSMEEIVSSLQNKESSSPSLGLWGIDDSESDAEDDAQPISSNSLLQITKNSESEKLRKESKNQDVSPEDERLAIDNWVSFHETKSNVDCTKSDNDILIDIMKSSAGIKGWAFKQAGKKQTTLLNSFTVLDDNESEEEVSEDEDEEDEDEEDEDEDEDEDEEDEDEDEDEEDADSKEFSQSNCTKVDTSVENNHLNKEEEEPLYLAGALIAQKNKTDIIDDGNSSENENEEEDDEDEEVEVEELVIDGKTYYTDDAKNGSLFEYLEDGEIGDIVGHLENGSGFFLTI